MISRKVLWLGLLLAPGAMAQSVPGMPQIEPLPDAQAVREVDGALQLGAPGPDIRREVMPGPSEPAPRPEYAADLQASAPSAPAPAVEPAEDEEDDLRPPAPTITLRPGRNQMIAIARTHLNRLITPFPEPVVKSTAVATTTSIEGSVVYIATESPEPVTMFVMDANDPVHAMSLTLVPRDIPSVQVTLDLQGYFPQVAADHVDGGAGGGSQPHLDAIRDLMRALAQGEVPGGYAVRALKGSHPRMPECVIPGIEVTPAQLITGANVSVIVSRVRNVSTLATSVDERMCSANGVLAVAAWPNRQLSPGQETELFVAIARPNQPMVGSRPSTLQGGW